MKANRNIWLLLVMRGGWGGAGSLSAAPESIQETESPHHPVAQCVLCRLDSTVCRQLSLAWVPSKIKNWIHLRTHKSSYLVWYDGQMFSCYSELHEWDMFSSGQVPRLMLGTWSCLLAFLVGETKGKEQTPWVCQQVKACRNQPEYPKDANSIKPPLKKFFVLSHLDCKR